jgi:integrase
MNALRKALADYFTVRRALGFKLYRAEKLLGQFLTFVEDRGEDHLTTEAALAWATLPKRGRTWAFARLSVVRRFANHLRGIDPATEVPPTHLLVQQKGRATPYLYSESDIAALIAAAGTLRTPHRVATFRTLIALLAVTGMRVGESIQPPKPFQADGLVLDVHQVR